MQLDQQAVLTRREYTMKAWMKMLYAILGLPLMLGSFFVAKSTAFAPSRMGAIIPALFFLGGGIYVFASLLRSRLTIDGSRIEVQTAFREKTADLGEIEGYRTIQTRNSSYTQLRLKNGAGTVSIPNIFDVDEDYRRWLAQIPNLDERDRDALLSEIRQSEDLGTTPDERLAALATAKTIGIFATVVAVALAAASNFAPGFLHVLAGSLLALAPLWALIMIRQAPLLYAIFKRKADPRADLAFVLMAASFGYLFEISGVHLVSIKPLAPLMLGMVVLYCAPVLFVAGGISQLMGRSIALVFFAGLFGYSLTVALNARMDKGQVSPYRTTVVRKYETHGRSTSYTFYLAPWGPFDGTNRVSVTSSVYHNTGIGDSVCMNLHPGALHAAWFEVVDCSTQPEPPLQP